MLSSALNLPRHWRLRHRLAQHRGSNNISWDKFPSGDCCATVVHTIGQSGLNLRYNWFENSDLEFLDPITDVFHLKSRVKIGQKVIPISENFGLRDSYWRRVQSFECNNNRLFLAKYLSWYSWRLFHLSWPTRTGWRHLPLQQWTCGNGLFLCLRPLILSDLKTVNKISINWSDCKRTTEFILFLMFMKSPQNRVSHSRAIWPCNSRDCVAKCAFLWKLFIFLSCNFWIFLF